MLSPCSFSVLFTLSPVIPVTHDPTPVTRVTRWLAEQKNKRLTRCAPASPAYTR